MNRQILNFALCLLIGIAAPAQANDVDIEKIRSIVNTSDQAGALVKLEPLMRGDYLENAEAQFYYGRSLYGLKHYSDAKVCFDKALALGLEGWQEDTAKSELAIINSGPSVNTSSNAHGGLRGFLGIRLNHNVVHSVLPDSPSELARILPGDTILAIDTVSTKNMADKDIFDRLRGVSGSAVLLTILRGGKQYSSKVVRAYAAEEPGVEAVFQRPKLATRVSSAASGAVSAATSASANDQALVKVFRRTAETDAIRSQVLAAVARIPQNIKKRFASAGVTILIVPTVLEARRDLAGQKPRGYDNGGGYDNCGGMYMPSEKTIYVAERYGIQNQPYKLSRESYETTLHESGHALDSLTWDTTRTELSKAEEFTSVYKKESESLSNSSRSHVTYFLQSGDAGGAELFAELFVAICDPQAKDDYNVVKTFPRTYSYLQSLVQQQ